MRRRGAVLGLSKLVAAALLAAACSDVAGPAGARRSLGPPSYSFSPNGITLSGEASSLFESGRMLAKGFNQNHPHLHDAVIATIFWVGPAHVDSVTDFQTNAQRTPIGNTFHLVESVTLGNYSMATFVATNIQNFPDPQPDPSIVYAVQAFMSDSVPDGGLELSSWTGVEDVFTSALGAHASGSGTASTDATVGPGSVAIADGALAYGVTMSNGFVGRTRPTGYTGLNVQSDNSIVTQADYLVQAGAGTTNPQWTWFFNQPSTWLASVVVLNRAAGTSSPGDLTATTSTTGSNLDPDGYTVTVDGTTSQAIGINGSVTFTGLASGSHSVALSGVAANCTVSGTNPQTVNVPSGGTATAAFTVSCTATTGDLTATTSTTGSNLDPDGYTVTVDGTTSQAITVNGSVTFTGLASGSHSVALSGVAANCTVSGANPQTVNVPAGSTATAAFTVSCSATTGNLTVSASTTGSNLDPDGYTVTVDAGSPQALAINGSVSYTNLASGSHTVAISGVAGNCTVSGGTSQTANVPAGGTVTATFTVSCTATTGNLTVSTSTSGSSLDPDGYTVTVDGGSSQAIGINASVSYTNLSAGSHSVQLTGVAANCTVSGSNPQSISVPSGGTASTTFAVSCVTPPGNLTVTTSTSGSTLDPNGYTVTVDGSTSQAIGINASVTFTNLSAGSHSVQLTGVASNCTVSGSNPRSVSVPSGGTVSTTFTVSCVTPPGNLTVTTSTSGSTLDPNGYTVIVDGSTSQAIDINASVTFTNLSAGSHSVQLTGVASNCTVSGSNPRSVSVPSGGTVSTTFSVSCVTPNTAPVVNAGADETVLLGVLYTTSFSFSDPDNGPWTYTIDWGDGSTSTGSRSTQGSFSASHTYLGILTQRTIRVTVTDSQGASGSDTRVITLIL